jgi:sarcosine oxidase subunit beta
MVKQAEYQKSKGLGVEVLNSKETRNVLPVLNKKLEILGSIYCPTDATVNPLFVCKAYARAARRLGADVRENEALERLEIKSGQVVAATTDRAEYRSEAFVIAAGAWSRAICNQVGLDYPMEVKRSQLMVTEALPPIFTEFVTSDVCRPYFRQSMNGGVHIGVPSAPVAGYNKLSTYNSFKIAGEGSISLFPFLEKVSVLHAWAGLTNFTPDSVCLLDKAPEMANLFLAAGHSGRGFCLGPITGRLITEWIVDGAPSIDLTNVRWTRFDNIFL